MVEIGLVLGYIALYATIGVQGLLEYVAKGVTNVPLVMVETRTPWALLLAEVVALPLAVSGMILYAAEVDSTMLTRAWRVVFPLLLLFFAFEKLYFYRALLRDPHANVTTEDVASAARVATVVSSVLELPSLWMNLRLAFPT